MSENDVTSLLKGEIVLSSEIAKKCAELFNTPYTFWINLEQLYRIKLKSKSSKSKEVLRIYTK